jgi:hypothetical protein
MADAPECPKVVDMCSHAMLGFELWCLTVGTRWRPIQDVDGGGDDFSQEVP